MKLFIFIMLLNGILPYHIIFLLCIALDANNVV